MVILTIVVVGILLSLVGFAVLVAAARALVRPVRERRIEYELPEPGLISLPSTNETRLPGRFGLTVGEGHLRIGDAEPALPPAFAMAYGHRVLRTAEVGQDPIAPSGAGWWRRDVFLNPGQANLKFDEVDVSTELGPSPAWAVSPAAASADIWAIHLHGIRTTRSVTVPTVICASRAGLTSLVPSWRNDGEGLATKRGGSMLGASESRDVEAAIEHAVEHGARRIVLIGWSMGGQIALRLAGTSRHRDRIAGLVLVAPLSSWRAVLNNAVAAARLPGFVASAVTSLLKRRWFSRVVRIHAPVDLEALDAQAQSTAPTGPCLVIHNPADQLVPFQLSKQMVARLRGQDQGNELVELEVFGDSPHALEWNCDPERFEERVTTWLRSVAKSLKEPDAAPKRSGAMPDGS